MDTLGSPVKKREEKGVISIIGFIPHQVLFNSLLREEGYRLHIISIMNFLKCAVVVERPSF